MRIGQNGFGYNPNFDILGGQYAALGWLSPKGDHLETWGIAPEIGVTIGKSNVTGRVVPNIEMRLVLRDGSTGERKAVAVGMSDQNGSVAIVFRDQIGHRVPVASATLSAGLPSQMISTGSFQISRRSRM